VNHAVHFYGADDELADSVGRYLADGIRSGEGVLVVATTPHRLAFKARLARDGIDAGRERRAGRLLTVDASGLLAVADQRSFPAERNSVRAARHYVTGLFGEGAGEAAACDTAIVATELAANAVLHARSAFTLTVSRTAEVTRIAVRDNTPVAAAEPQASGKGMPFQVMTGHGLSVVAQLARRWAVDPLPDGKVVWAELRVPGLP
jgi:anti-sigma regulatory factor (Ser/Thr protein kinase)